MNIIADTHTHTLACDHAYSTISENAAAAAGKGLRFLAMTEHTPQMPGAPTPIHFMNLRAIPHVLNGVVLLKGAEANIMDNTGAFDLPDHVLERLDWVIASMHIPTFPPATPQAHTEAWLAVAENPLVDVIGHCGDGRYAFDEDRVLPAFAKNGKIVEINSHSFSARPNCKENCPRIARKCAELGIPIVVNSDAHFCSSIGEFTQALEALEAIDFPEELVLNADYERFLAAAKARASKHTLRFLETL